MQNHSPHANARTDQAGGRFTRVIGRTGVLGGALSFALLFNTLPAVTAAAAAGQIVTVEWTPSPAYGVTGYNVFYGGASGDYTNMINVGNVTNASISGLAAGMTFYFAATAYDELGYESPYSSEVSYIVPTPLATLQLGSAAGGGVVLNVAGLAGHTYEILATQDLSAWTVIGTVTLGAAGSLDFTDPTAANYPLRFYRTRETP